MITELFQRDIKVTPGDGLYGTNFNKDVNVILTTTLVTLM